MVQSNPVRESLCEIFMARPECGLLIWNFLNYSAALNAAQR
jgi:hypothetical protein